MNEATDVQVVSAAHREPASGRASARPERLAERRRARTLVLLVDDLEDQRDLYRQYLEFAGYEVVVARDGFEGIDCALKVSPDVVVMDLSMPGLDGFEATQRLKELAATSAIPVIALTAHGALPREWALRAGCDSYLTKPCYPDELGSAISDVLAKPARRLPRPEAASVAPGRPHVLVIDSSVADRELLAEYLEYRGCLVTVSVDLGGGLRDAKRVRPSVILLDLDAPRISAWDTLTHLRHDPATRDIPVVATSRKALASARAGSLGAELLIKPCEPEAVYVQLCRAATSAPPLH
jgi:two-component system, cell cycle response regulator DivK